MKQKFISTLTILLTVIVFVSGCSSQESKSVCGNNNCEAGENKCNCPSDCGQCSGSAGTCLEYSCSNNQCVTQKISGCCGNQVCEGTENYDTCPTDCTTKTSVEQSIAKIKISGSDLPMPIPYPYHRDILWYDKGVDGGIDESYSPLNLQNFKPLAGWEVAIYPAVKEGDLYVDISVGGWIRQYIYAFPLEEVSKVFSAAELKIPPQLAPQVKIEDLPNPGIGDESKAFKISFASEERVEQTYFIVFIKKGYFEILTMDGKPFEYKVLEDAARKAAGKIN